MESDHEPSRDIDQQIQELTERCTDADTKLLSRTCMRLNTELRRLAQDERRLGTYLVATRRLSEAGLHFTPQNSLDLTVRLIAMLEEILHRRWGRSTATTPKACISVLRTD